MIAGMIAIAALPLRAEEVGSETASRPIRFALVPHEPIPLPPIDSVSRGTLLTLAEAEAMAVAWHPAMRQAEGQVRAERGQWVQVGLPNNPQIAYEGTEIGDEGRAGMQGGVVSQEVITANKRD